MCGIVGVVHKDESLRIAIDAIKRLEYRGYDSFGAATLQPDHIAGKKDVGSVTENDAHGFFDSIPDSTISLAHTRWATTGEVTQANAHPHLSFDGKFSLVHNGVIENYRQLRQDLLRDGIECQSETDTEVIVHLLAKNYMRTLDVLEAVRCTVDSLEGEYGLAFITQVDPENIYGVRFKSPLSFGHIDNMSIIASDQRAIAPLTQHMTFLEDGDIVKASAQKVTCYTNNLSKVRRSETYLPWTDDDNGKQGYSHYMAKEIHESPIAVKTALAISDDSLAKTIGQLKDRELNITGAGSAFYVSQIGQYYFALLAGKYARMHPADEFLGLLQPDSKDHLIAISQSGETFDTIEVIRASIDNGASVTSINNVLGSSCQRLADYPIFQGAGAEVCVLSTKSIISQTMILHRLAILSGLETGRLDGEEFDKLTEDAKRLPGVIEKLFEDSEKKIEEIAIANCHIDNWFFIGRGIYHPVAMESALKFKEVSYLHAEGMPAGFFKHGTISLIDNNFYTIAFLPNKLHDPDNFRFTMSNISEIQARGGRVIAFGHEDEDEEEISSLWDYARLPSINKYLDPVLHLVAGQILAYYCARTLGRNIDKPRALAKSVTVR